MSRIRVAALGVMLASLTAAPAGAAPGPAACTPGPARAASEAAPHAVDGVGDGIPPWSAIYGSATDLVSAWVTGPSAWADRDSTQSFFAHIRLDELDVGPHTTLFYFTYPGPRGVQFVSAQTSALSPPRYEYGWWEPNDFGGTYRVLGQTTGSFGTTTPTWSIRIPYSQLPPRTPEELSFTDYRAVARLTVVKTVDVGDQKQRELAFDVDATDSHCRITLYEAM